MDEYVVAERTRPVVRSTTTTSACPVRSFFGRGAEYVTAPTRTSGIPSAETPVRTGTSTCRGTTRSFTRSVVRSSPVPEAKESV